MEFADLIITPKLDGVILHSPFTDPVDGTLCITGHHMILSSRKEDVQELWVMLLECNLKNYSLFFMFKLLHQSIDIVERKQNSSANNSLNGGSIILKCKDLRVLQLDISNSEDYHNIFLSIQRLSNLEKPDLLYPFFYRHMYSILEDGYTLFSPEIEYSKLISSEEFRITNINKNYTVCNTYSSTLVVPKSIDDDTIVAAANFREGGRFPLISYRHENGTVLLKSSQPLLNNGNKRCRADEKILNAVLGPYKKGYIIDMRSATYINNCKSKGGGTEPEGNYAQWKKVCKPLDKISKCDGSVMEHLLKLIEGRFFSSPNVIIT